jgi:hypothetical protein
MNASLVGEGQLDIALRLADRHIIDVTIRSNRPVLAARGFSGRRPAEVVSALPLVYSVCGIAQAVAAAEACESALGCSVGERQRRARALLVAAETAREQLSRVFLEWPKWLGRPPEVSAARTAIDLPPTLRRALSGRNDPLALGHQTLAIDSAQCATVCASLSDLLEAHVFGTSPAEWQQIADEAALRAWAAVTGTTPARMIRRVFAEAWPAFGRSAVAALPELPLSALKERLLGEGSETFLAQPSWQDEPRETSVFTRWHHSPLVRALAARYGSGVMARLAARLVELAASPAHLRQCLGTVARADSGAEPPTRAAGVGIGQVEAARGRLVHCAEIEQGRVRRYRILAPTEWNFHPRGAFAQGLLGARVLDRSRCEAQIACFAGAVDPCVAHRLIIGG